MAALGNNLPSDYKSIKSAIFICFAALIFSIFSSSIETWEIPFLGLGTLTTQGFLISLLCFSSYFAITFVLEWFKFDKDIRQKKVWLVEFWLTLIIAFSVIAFTFYQVFIEPTGWTPSAYDVITVVILIALGEFVASNMEIIIWDLRLIRDKDEAAAKKLPRIPVVVQSVLGVLLPVNILVILLTVFGSHFLIQEHLKPIWYYFFILPFLVHILFSLLKADKIDFEAIKQATEWHDTMCVTQGGRYVLDNETLLYEAASKGNFDEVKRYMENGLDPNEVNTQGWSPLMISIANGHKETAELLIHYGANINQANTLRRTPLMFASRYGYLEIVKMLLEAGAETNVNDIENTGTPLISASAAGHEEIVKLLLEHGADPNIKSSEGKTALDYAQENGYGEIARVLRKSL